MSGPRALADRWGHADVLHEGKTLCRAELAHRSAYVADLMERIDGGDEDLNLVLPDPDDPTDEGGEWGCHWCTKPLPTDTHGPKPGVTMFYCSLPCRRSAHKAQHRLHDFAKRARRRKDKQRVLRDRQWNGTSRRETTSA